MAHTRNTLFLSLLAMIVAGTTALASDRAIDPLLAGGMVHACVAMLAGRTDEG